MSDGSGVCQWASPLSHRSQRAASTRVVRRWATTVGQALLLAAVTGAGPGQSFRDPPVFSVAPISLNNLSNQPEPDGEAEALLLLRQRIEERLTTCGFRVVAGDLPAADSAALLPGYLFLHPDLPAAAAAARGADWALVGRLNRASPWVVDLEVHVVPVTTGIPVNTRIVELKGFGMNPDLTARLAERGAAWLVDQVLQVVSRADAGPEGRPCPR